jgi:hypothetical protein
MLSMVAGGPAVSLIKLIAEKTAGIQFDVPENADLSAVLAETERQENELRRLEGQAKVAQEMAIASRIENAGEVHIEEYYEYSADGKAGFNADAATIALGVSGAGKRISKRVIKFIGSTTDQISSRHEIMREGDPGVVGPETA